MSAFCGHFRVDGEPADAQHLNVQLDAVKIWGPDDHGTFLKGPVAVAHARLGITPESELETSPWIGCEGRLVVAFDGRLDHREDLLDQLGIRGTERNLPDPELLARSFERWGEDCLDRVEGEFAFVIWNRRENCIFAACESFERRGFFYHFDGRRFAFASVIRGVLALPDVPRRLDEFALACRLDLTPHPSERTLYTGIFRLTGGHSLTIGERGEPRVQRFWTLGAGPEIRLQSPELYVEALRELLDRSVNSALRSRYPVAAMLSGGLDSTGVAGLAAREYAATGQRLTVVSNVLPPEFDGPTRNREESGFIAEVLARYPNMDGLQVRGDEAPAIDFNDGWYELHDEPDVDFKSFRTRALCQVAVDAGARVLLSGYGGDMAASYHGRGYLERLFRAGRWLEMLRQMDLQNAAQGGTRLSRFRREVLRPVMPGVWRRWRDRLQGRADDRLCPIHPEFFQRMNIAEWRREAEAVGNPSDLRVPLRRGYNSQVSVGNVRWPLPMTPLLECPQPLMDRRLWEWCQRIPIGEFVRDGRARGLFRDALQDVLPGRIRDRTDKGWFAPDYQQRLAECTEGIRDFLSQHPASETMWNYVDRSKVEECLDRLSCRKFDQRSSIRFQLVLCHGLRIAEFIKQLG